MQIVLERGWTYAHGATRRKLRSGVSARGEGVRGQRCSLRRKVMVAGCRINEDNGDEELNRMQLRRRTRRRKNYKNEA